MYENKRISKDIIGNLEKTYQGDVKLKILTDKDDINFLAIETYTSTKKIMSSKRFRGELSNWVRNNMTKKADGMPAYVQGMPLPISFIAKFVIRSNSGVAESQAKMDKKRVLNSSAICLILVSKQDLESWINAGRVYQRFCLLALQNGVKTAGTSAPIIDSQTSAEIINKFKLKNHPVAFIRMGYKNGHQKASPRLSKEQILISA